MFLSRAGAVPFDSVPVATGMKKGDCNKALNVLRGAGYAFPQHIDGVEWWISAESVEGLMNIQGREILAWFIARLEEAGGYYNNGIARYPKGKELPVQISESSVQTGDICANLEDLREKPLRECLKRNKDQASRTGIKTPN